jgi:hypothetical protein
MNAKLLLLCSLATVVAVGCMVVSESKPADTAPPPPAPATATATATTTATATASGTTRARPALKAVPAPAGSVPVDGGAK